MTSNRPRTTNHWSRATGLWLLGLARGIIRRFLAHDCPLLAAGLAFYTILSLFPLLLGLTAIFGLLMESAALQQQLIAMVGSAFPGSTDLINRTVDEAVDARGTIGVVSLLTLMWTATQVFAALRRALNRAWNVEHTRPFVRQKLLEMGMVGSVALLVLVSWAAVSLFFVIRPLLPAALWVPGSGSVAGVVTALVPVALSFGVFALLYRFVPETSVTWADSWPGALLAALLFEAGKYAFSWYLANVARYSLLYGSLGTTIAFLMWAYLSALILLLGAELTAEYAHLRRAKPALP